MKCSNCGGAGVFRDLDCSLCVTPEKRKTPDPSCKRCGGTGKEDSVCVYCKGLGTVPDIYVFTFRNTETAKALIVTVDLASPPENFVKKREIPNFSFPGLIMREWYVAADDLFKDACAALGVSRSTHFMYKNGRLLEFGFPFSPLFAASNRAGHDPDPDPAEIMERARQAFSMHFVWYLYNPITGEPEGLTFDFVERKPTEELLDELWQKVSSRGYIYEFRVWEGNIATGERGWALFILSPDERFGAKLSVAYDLEVAVKEGLERVEETIQKLDQKRRFFVRIFQFLLDIWRFCHRALFGRKKK